MAEPLTFDFLEKRILYRKGASEIARLGGWAEQSAARVHAAAVKLTQERKRFEDISRQADDHSGTLRDTVDAGIEQLAQQLEGRQFAVSGIIMATRRMYADHEPVEVVDLPAQVSQVRNVPQEQLDTNGEIIYHALRKHGDLEERTFEPVYAENAYMPAGQRLAFNPHLQYGNFDPVAILDIADEDRAAAGLFHTGVEDDYDYRRRLARLSFARLEDVTLTLVEE